MTRGASPRRASLFAAAAAAASLAVSFFSISRHFEGGVTWEFCHYAEIGRNLAEGRGYGTAMVPPYVLAWLDARGVPFDERTLAPVLDRFPLQAALSAAALRLAGGDDAAIAALAAGLLAACAAGTVLLGAALFSAEEGLAAGLLLAFNPSLQRAFVLWGLPDLAFLILAAAAAGLLALEPPPARRAALLRGAPAGALAALAWLARSNLVLWLPLFAWALWRGPAGARGARAASFAAAFLAVSAPGWTYNLRWFGSVNPPTFAWNLAHHTVTDTPPWLAYGVVDAGTVLRDHLPELGRKFWRNLALYLRDFPALWQLHLAAPLALFAAWKLSRERAGSPAGRWAALMAAMLAVQVLVFSFLRYEAFGPLVKGRYLLWFMPAALLLAARGGMELGRALGRPRTGLALSAALNLAWFLSHLAGPQGLAAYPGRVRPAAWPEIAAAAEATAPGLIVTNLPGPVVWYARRAAVALPATPGDLARIAARRPVSAVLLSRLPIGELPQTPAWLPYAAAGAGGAELWKRLGFRVQRDFGTSLLLVPR